MKDFHISIVRILDIDKNSTPNVTFWGGGVGRVQTHENPIWNQNVQNPHQNPYIQTSLF